MGNLIEIPSVIAHRGASGSAPENTLAALYAAKVLGAKWVEFDVKMAGCGQLCLIHNNNLSITSNGLGLVSETAYKDLAQLDAGAWFSEKFRGERIPRLIDAIHCLDACKLSANIELKPDRGRENQMALKLVATLKRRWPDHMPAPLISSFSIKCLRKIRSLDKNIPIGLLLYRWTRRWKRLVNELDCISVHCQHRSLTPRRIKALKKQNCSILAYTVNSIEAGKRLFSLGVDGIFTDYPEHFLQLFARKV